jgi:phosphohistidine phosphatase
MQTLLVLRHAKSSLNSPTGEDRDRPLNARGERDAQAMGKALRKLDLVPTRVLCSPAARTRQTADLFLEKCRFVGEIEYRDEIYLAEPNILVDLIRRQSPCSTLLIIGHNPGLESLVGLMTTGSARAAHFPTAALARIDFAIDDWKHVLDPKGELIWLLTPDLVHKL